MRGLLLLLPLAACGVHTRTEQRWSGPLTPTTARPECAPTHALLTLRDDVVTFAPDEGTWVLTGRATGTTLSATHEHPTPDHRLYRTRLDATRSEAGITGTYTTPICTYRLTLEPL